MSGALPAPIIGAHTIDAGGAHMAVRRAANAGMRTLQFFTAVPKFYNDKAAAKPDKVARFGEACAAAGIDPRHVIVHAGYVLNTASPEPEKADRARVALAKELERSTAYGVGGVCFHPGSAGDSPREEAAARVGATIAFALAQVPGGATRLLVENTAGAGRTMGKTPDEIALMLAQVPAAERGRTGYGLDTCHLFASGHDIGSSAASLTAVLDAFEQGIGERPAFFHCNDSQHPLGSNKDRHALIGEGMIGVEPFRWLLADPRSRGVPLILETPQQLEEQGEDDDTADPFDVRMVQLLHSLAT